MDVSLSGAETFRVPVAGWWEREPDRRTRIGAASLIAFVAVSVFLIHTAYGADYVRGTGADLGGALEGARRLLDGQRNIYATPYAPYASAYPLSYPLTTSLLLLPLAWLTPRVAAAVFVALTTGVAAYVLSRRRLDELLLFASAPAVFAWCWAQWSPLLLVQGVTAFSVVAGIAKPQLGIAMFAFRPNRRGLWIAAAVATATLLLSPTWPLDWLSGSLNDATEVREHLGALFAPLGFTLLVAVVRWRDPRARLLLALAVIPNRLAFYDQLCLGLVADTPRRRVGWVVSTWVAAAGWAAARAMTGGEALVAREALVVLLVCWPALLFVLYPAARRGASGASSAEPATF